MTTASIYVNPNATPQNNTEMNNYRAVLAASPPAGMKPCQSAIVVPAGKTGRHRVGITDEAGNLHVMAHEEDVSDLAAEVALKENAFLKNDAFNKNFGTTAGTVCEGNDSRIVDIYDPRNYGDTNKTGVNIALACADAVSSGGRVRLAGGNYTISANVDFLDVPIEFEFGAQLIVNPGYALAGLNVWGIPRHKIIDCAASDVPGFTPLGFVNPEWFGFYRKETAEGADSAGNAAAIVKSLTVGNIQIPRGTYLVGAIVYDGDHRIIAGSGMVSTTLESTEDDGESLWLKGDFHVLRDLTFDGADTADELRIETETIFEMSNVQIKGHAGKNCWLSSLEAKIDHCIFTPSYAEGITPFSALYTDWNAVEITGQSYFNTQNRCPCIVLGRHPVHDELRNIVIQNNVFENATIGIEILDNVKSAGINIRDNYFELIHEATSEMVRVTGGVHQSLNISGNHCGSAVKSSFVFDRVDKTSHINITENNIFRPIRIFTTASLPATSIDIRNMPAFNISSQNKLFTTPEFTSPTRPTVIVDNYIAFESMSVARILYPGYDYAYASFKGKAVFESPGATEIDPLRIRLLNSGGGVYAHAVELSALVRWRRKAESHPIFSYQIETHRVKCIGRNTGTISLGQSCESLTSEGSYTSDFVSGARLESENTEQWVMLMLKGDGDAELNQWLVDIDAQMYV